jgi:hypothetical protein
MKAHSGEFDDARSAFEKTVNSKETCFYLPNLKRSSRSDKNSFYENGDTDKYFQMFLQGYEYAKALHRMEE